MRHLAPVSASLLALLIALPARAEVTATEVWSDWKAHMESYGYQLQAREDLAGKVLTVSDVTMTTQMPENGGTVSVAMDRMTLTEQADGTVAVVMPGTMPIVAAFKGTDDSAIDLAIDYTQTGMTMTVSGDASAMNYAYTAQELALTATRIVVDGAAVDLRTARAAMTDVTGETRNARSGTLHSSGQTMTVGAINWTLDMTNPEDQTPIKIAGQMQGVGLNATVQMPAGLNIGDMAAMMAAGFAVDGGLTHKGGSSDMSFVTDGQLSTITSASTSGDLTVRMGQSSLAYRGAATGARYEFLGGPVPVPMTLDIADVGFNLLMPVQKSDEPKDFALGLTLADVVMSDIIWSMLDPTGQLPRDPATLALDLTGKARITTDFADPALVTSTGAPGEIHALTLKGLTLRLAGADLSGTGDFTFDNTDQTTVPGMPRPEGAANLKLIGGNALLDKLIAMGLLPAEQAMGIRLMMSAFGKMEAEDTLTSKIEFTPDGQITANGQRIR
jgi:hypothetical protein